ncbi:transposase, partial [Saccharothrix variisporea]
MAHKKSRRHSAEFREAAAREVVDRSRPVDDVARDCGVTGQ